MIYSTESDVVVVGGGPAGISACLELARLSLLSVTLIEAEAEVGGVPRHCGPGFGMRDQGRFMSGPAYAARLAGLLRRTGVRRLTETTALSIRADRDRDGYLIETASPQGAGLHSCLRLILAAGCFETSRESRLIPGDRPAGIITTGTLQQLVKARGLKPGRRALILGAESVSLSAGLTLRRAGVNLAGLVGPEVFPDTYPWAFTALTKALRLPVHRPAQVKAIIGRGRVQGVALDLAGQEEFVSCDAVIVSGRFRPDAGLAENMGLAIDPDSRGPLVDQDLRTSATGVYAAGNQLRGANMHDLCALEGRRAARSLMIDLHRPAWPVGDKIRLVARPPIRFVVPQYIDRATINGRQTGAPGSVFSIQLTKTLIDPVIEVSSGGRSIWRKRYCRLVGRTRIALPVDRFNLSAINPEEELVVTVSQ